MRTWKVVVVGSIVGALAVILATAYLEASGLIRLPGPPMGQQIGARLLAFRGLPVAEAGPYIEAAVGLLLQFLIGTLVLYAAPERMRRLTDAVAAGAREILRFLLIGLLLAVALGAVALLSAFYIHTAMLPFVLGGGIFLGALVGAEALALALGRGLLRRAGWSGGSPLAALFVGTILLVAATRIPYLAVAVLILLGLTGAGAALSTRFGGRRTWTLDPLREVPEL